MLYSDYYKYSQDDNPRKPLTKEERDYNPRLPLTEKARNKRYIEIYKKYYTPSLEKYKRSFNVYFTIFIVLLILIFLLFSKTLFIALISGLIVEKLSSYLNKPSETKDYKVRGGNINYDQPEDEIAKEAKQRAFKQSIELVKRKFIGILVFSAFLFIEHDIRNGLQIIFNYAEEIFFQFL